MIKHAHSAGASTPLQPWNILEHPQVFTLSGETLWSLSLGKRASSPALPWLNISGPSLSVSGHASMQTVVYAYVSIHPVNHHFHRMTDNPETETQKTHSKKEKKTVAFLTKPCQIDMHHCTRVNNNQPLPGCATMAHHTSPSPI